MPAIDQDKYIAKRIAENQVGKAVAQACDCQAGRIKAGWNPGRPLARINQPALTIVQEDLHFTRFEDGDVGQAVASEVAHRDRQRGLGGVKCDRIAIAPATESRQHVQLIRPRCDRDQIGRLIRIESGRGNSRDPCQAGDVIGRVRV